MFHQNAVIFVTLLSLFDIGNFRGTCSSVKMLKVKGYVVRERFGIPDLKRNLKHGSPHFYPAYLQQSQDSFSVAVVVTTTRNILSKPADFWYF